MIKKLLNKIKDLFTKKEIVETKVECPYKLEPKEEISNIQKEDIKIVDVEAVNKKDILECEHCKQELKGKESAEDENGIKYIWCKNCNYVNKIKGGKVVRKEDNITEIKRAFELFKQAGASPSSYAYTEKGEKRSF